MKLKLFSLKIFLVCASLIFLALSRSAFSQDNEFESYMFDDDKASTQKTPYFALSFGVTTSFLFMNYDDINSKPLPKTSLEAESWKDVFGKEFSGQMRTIGFNFFTALSPLVNNARLGVSYQTGSMQLEKTHYTRIENDTHSEIVEAENYFRNLSVRMTGGHFDYAIVPMKSLAILPGVGVKWGKMTLEQYMTSIPASWNEGLVTSNSISEKLNYSFLSFEPQVSVEYALTGFFMIRAAGSYMVTIDRPLAKNVWTINGNNPYSGVPKGVKPQGFALTLGLYLGLFNY